MFVNELVSGLSFIKGERVDFPDFQDKGVVHIDLVIIRAA